jgi:uncharacterized cupin superfamily protein
VAAYTIQNMKEVEDQAPKFGHSPHLEARMARVPLELEEFGISYQRIAPGFRVPFAHTHKNQEEVYVVVSGSMRVKLGDDIVELSSGTRFASRRRRCGRSKAAPRAPR